MTVDMRALAERWRRDIDETEATLRALSDERARRRPAPGKWSVKEVVGHMIDSAANNHRRFVVAQLRDGLVFDGYEQDGWVTKQNYQESPWPDLVTFWAAFNRHLIHVASHVAPALLDKQQLPHNFDQVASRSVPPTQPSSLGFFIDDYVFHLEHHLGQIRALIG